MHRKRWWSECRWRHGRRATPPERPRNRRSARQEFGARATELRPVTRNPRSTTRDRRPLTCDCRPTRDHRPLMTRKRSNVYATDVQRDVMWRPKTERLPNSMFARERSSLASKQEVMPRSHARNASRSHARATIVWRPREGTYSRPITIRATHHTARTSTQQTLCATRVWRPSDGTPFQTERSRARYRHKILPPRRSGINKGASTPFVLGPHRAY